MSISAKLKIKQAFASASSSYDDAAVLQRRVGNALLQDIDSIENKVILDIGCGTGFMFDQLVQRENKANSQLFALDIAESMLYSARNRLGVKSAIAYVCADVEALPLLANSMDIVISNLALQWCYDIHHAFTEIKRVLRPDGRLYFTTFGTQTLQELKNAWREVDDYKHVNDFHNAMQLAEFLQQAGFFNSAIETCSYLSTYESVWDLMTELKQLGAQTVTKGRNKRITSKAAMERMICAYQKQDENGLIPATFEVITVSAQA